MLYQKRNSRYAIADALSERIRAGKYQPGENLPSRNKLAAEFNAHRNTLKEVFSLLRQRGLIESSPGACVKVASMLSRPLKVAAILPEDYGNMDVLLGINESLKSYDASVETMFYKTPDEQLECLKRLKEKHFSGAIIRPDFSGHGYGDVCKIQNDKLPIVLIENFYPDSKEWHVDAGAFDAGVMAVEHFHKERREPIALVCPGDKFGEAFINGYQEAHFKLKEECHRNNIRSLEHGRTAGEASVELMKIKNPPHSIIYTSSQDAIDGYKMLKEHGADLRRIKLLSFGESLVFEFLEHPIISIKRDFKELGRKAGMLLAEQVSGASNQTAQHNEKVKVEFKS